MVKITYLLKLVMKRHDKNTYLLKLVMKGNENINNSFW